MSLLKKLRWIVGGEVKLENLVPNIRSDEELTLETSAWNVSLYGGNVTLPNLSDTKFSW